MSKIYSLALIMTVLCNILLFSTISMASADNFSYSVSEGDKIPYQVTILDNGSSPAWLTAWGLSLSVGSEIYIQIVSCPETPTKSWGAEFDIQIVTDTENGTTYWGQNLIFSDNTSYWKNDSFNRDYNIETTVYEFSLEGDIGTFVRNNPLTSEDKYEIVTFDINTGLLITYEEKSDNGIIYVGFDISHIRIEKVATSSSPSFELPLVLFGCGVLVVVFRSRKTWQ